MKLFINGIICFSKVFFHWRINQFNEVVQQNLHLKAVRKFGLLWKAVFFFNTDGYFDFNSGNWTKTDYLLNWTRTDYLLKKTNFGNTYKNRITYREFPFLQISVFIRNIMQYISKCNKVLLKLNRIESNQMNKTNEEWKV